MRCKSTFHHKVLYTHTVLLCQEKRVVFVFSDRESVWCRRVMGESSRTPEIKVKSPKKSLTEITTPTSFWTAKKTAATEFVPHYLRMLCIGNGRVSACGWSGY